MVQSSVSWTKKQRNRPHNTISKASQKVNQLKRCNNHLKEAVEGEALFSNQD
jgi:hypothetical protein